MPDRASSPVGITKSDGGSEQGPLKTALRKGEARAVGANRSERRDRTIMPVMNCIWDKRKDSRKDKPKEVMFNDVGGVVHRGFYSIFFNSDPRT